MSTLAARLVRPNQLTRGRTWADRRLARRVEAALRAADLDDAGLQLFVRGRSVIVAGEISAQDHARLDRALDAVFGLQRISDHTSQTAHS